MNGFATDLEQYKNEMSGELDSILGYWMQYTPDLVNGGFYGKIDNNNAVCNTAPKGSVLNSRILWSFSAAYNLTKKAEYLSAANRAYNYITDHFIDKEFGGVFWTVDYKGHPLDTKKQIYALSFLQYACSEYFQCNSLPEIKQLAVDLYYLIEQYSFDNIRSGYLEAFTRDWKTIKDMRLSAKDANEKKTMNTHLHILEAYTNLYRIWNSKDLKQSIILLIKNFTEHIINKESGHLNLFFDEDWNNKADIISYGHDIEAAWLLLEAAEVIEDDVLIQEMKIIAVKITEAVKEGLDTDGALWYEKEAGHLVRQKHSWPQAEAMIGFLNAFEITNDTNYLLHSLNSWSFVKKNIKDALLGEWFWGIEGEGMPMKGEDKVGLWKCPYHNSRACIEIIKRINKLNKYN